MVRPAASRLTRRHFLAAAGATGAAVALGACGGGDDESSEEPSSTTSSDRQLVLAPFLQGPFYATGITSRVVFGLADSEGLLRLEDTPEEIEIDLVAPDGRATAGPITLASHGEGLSQAYFALKVALDDPGIYTVRADLAEGGRSELAFEVKDAADVTVVKPGELLPPSLTPTTADAHGVDPICTAEPPCPFHEITVTDALAEGRPIALLVATPKFCKVSACGPVHDVFVSVVPDHPDVRALHAEVYVHPDQNLDDIAPVLRDLRLFAEPALFLVGSDGTVVERLDAIYDRVELDEALARLT